MNGGAPDGRMENSFAPLPDCPDCGADANVWPEPDTDMGPTAVVECTECEFRGVYYAPA